MSVCVRMCVCGCVCLRCLALWGLQARELSSLTGADVLLIISSEMSNVYDFSTPKFHGVLSKCKVSFFRCCITLEPSDGRYRRL